MRRRTSSELTGTALFQRFAQPSGWVAVNERFISLRHPALRMTLKKQWSTLKDNWLLVGLVLIVLCAALFMRPVGVFTANSFAGDMAQDGYYPSPSAVSMERGSLPYMPYDESFAPEVTERQQTKSASLTSEIDRGEFTTAQNRIQSILTANNAIILSENSNKHGKGVGAYEQGWYQVKIPVNTFDNTVAQLRAVGEVQSYNENVQDITEQFESVDTRIETEKARLARFQELFDSATRVEDRIQLADRIFELERTIKYLEESKSTLGERVSYSTLSISITEKQSGYANIAVVTFAQLTHTLVDSFNTLVQLAIMLLPWALVALLVVFVWKRVRAGKRK
jgi:hypothetical protein